MLPLLTAAHEVRPAYLEITEAANGSLHVLWKQPIMGEVAISLHPILSTWLNDSAAAMSHTESYLLKMWDIENPGTSLEGQQVVIKGLEGTITDVLLRITWRDGKNSTVLLNSRNPVFKIDVHHKAGLPIAAYLRLGVEHILYGADHLLFVLGLLLLVNSRKKLLTTITAFTIAHSITLALATLGLVHIQQSIAEAIIALSIVFVGVELLRHYRGEDGFTYRYPWVVAFVFGLLHGFGFAGALADLGLPEHSIPWALFLFNIGVEIGQLCFVTAVLTVGWLLRKGQPLYDRKLKWIIPYVVGSVAAFWFIERVTQVF